MKMRKLKSTDTIQPTDFIKAKSSKKAVLVSETAGLKVGSIDIYMDPDFEGYYRAVV